MNSKLYSVMFSLQGGDYITQSSSTCSMYAYLFFLQEPDNKQHLTERWRYKLREGKDICFLAGLLRIHASIAMKPPTIIWLHFSLRNGLSYIIQCKTVGEYWQWKEIHRPGKVNRESSLSLFKIRFFGDDIFPPMPAWRSISAKMHLKSL